MTQISKAYSVGNKPSDVVSINDFSPAADGTTNDRGVLVSALVACNGKTLQLETGVTYAIASGINGVTESITDVKLDLNGATIVFDVTGGAFNFLEDIDNLSILGPGQIGNDSQELTGDYSTINYTTSTSSLLLDMVDFQCGAAQYHAITSDEGTGPNRCYMNACNFRNFARYGVDLLVNNKGNAEAKHVIKNCYFKNIGISEAAPHRAIRIGSNLSESDNVTVSDCKFYDIYSGASDANAILIYGNGIVISGNFINTVNNTLADDAEAIYVKGTNFKVVNNHVVNGGNSHDGCIGVKGRPYSTGDQYSEYGVVANNTVEITDLNVDVPAITINRSNVVCHDNILTDTRSNRNGKTKSFAIGIGTSSPVSGVNVHDNRITGFRSFFGDDQTYRSQPTDNVSVHDNVCTMGDTGNAITLRTDAKRTADLVFVASGNTITITSSDFFDQNLYPVGALISITNSNSNDGQYTVTAVTELVLTVASGITDETKSDVNIFRDDAEGIKIHNNIFEFETQGGYGVRFRGGDPKHIDVHNNWFKKVNYGYRVDEGAPALLTHLGNNYQDLGTQEDYGGNTAVLESHNCTSSGTTGGSGSAGATNLYVEVDVNGTTYELLRRS